MVRVAVKSVTGATVDIIRDMIASGELAEGSGIVIDRLAEMLGTSHTPVREALRVMEAEGFVTLSPNRGGRVRALLASEFEELIGLRRLIETEIFRRAISAQGDDRFAPARALLNESDASPITPHSQLESSWRFLDALYQPAHQPRTLDIIRSNWRLIHRYHLRFWLQSDAVFAEEVAFKQGLLHAAESGDEDAAIGALNASIDWSATFVSPNLAP